MLKKIPGIYCLLAGNLIPFFLLIGSVSLCFLSVTFYLKILLLLLFVYIFPPLMTRLLHRVYGIPQGSYTIEDIGFKVWWLTAQLQALYLRFSFLEEILRIIPFIYSGWLRLWGSQIGSRIYWSPKTVVLDRSHLQLGSNIVVGYGAVFAPHHYNRSENLFELIIAKCVVEDGVILGGASGLGPGARVAKNETLPSTFPLAPFYEWRDNRRFSLKKQSAQENL